jgi:GNAT superfamily N-acetyltransferase
VGICVLGPGPLASAARNRLFGIDRLPRRVAAGVVNRHFTSVTRLVLDPRYRGAGIAGRFLARAAALAPTRWVELASEMGHLSRFAEAAGFVRIGLGADKLRTPGGRIRPPGATGGAWSQANCTAGARAAFARRTRHGRPVCYLLDNTPRAGKRSGDAPGG